MIRTKIKVKVPRDLTSLRVKKAKLVPAALRVTAEARKGAWQREQESVKARRVVGEPAKGVGLRGGADQTKSERKYPLALSNAVHLDMARDKASGETLEAIAQKYGTAVTYVSEALRKLYTSNAHGREILKGILLENGIAFGMRAAEKIKELNGMQSVVASGIMVQRFIDLDKHNAASGAEADLAEVQRVGKRIADLENCVSVDGHEISADGAEGGSIIDVTG